MNQSTPSIPQSATPTLGTISNQVVHLATDLSARAREHDDRRLARLAATADGTVADRHTSGELLAFVAGVSDAAAADGRQAR